MELTDQQGWSRRHGAIVGGADSRELIADLLHERNILAEIQWFASQEPHVSMVLAERHGRIATVTWDGDTAGELTEGPLIEDLVEELAEILDAEVRIGSIVVDRLPAHQPSEGEGSEVADEASAEEAREEIETVEDSRLKAPEQEDVFPASVRMVEISRTQLSSMPLFATMQKAPVASVELEGEQRALFADLKNGNKGWGFGELPTVTLVYDHDGVTILLVTDDHVEHMSSFDWTMHRQLIAGSRMDVSAGHLPDNLADLVTKRQDLLRIASAVEGASADLFTLAALEASEPDDWQVAVAALGLPRAVIDFLSGARKLEELEDVTVHKPLSVSSALGRKVDTALEEVSAAHPMWRAYENIVEERSALLRGAIVAEAVVGASLLVSAIVSKRPASVWKKLAGWGGALLIADSVAEFSVMRYVNKRLNGSRN